MKRFVVYIQPYSADVEIAVTVEDIYCHPSREEVIIDYIECSIDGVADDSLDELVTELLYNNYETLLGELTHQAWVDRQDDY